MAFDLIELTDAIKQYTDNDETSFVNNIPLFIRQAEERILKSVQLSLFRKNATAFVTDGNSYVAVPDDFLAPYSMSLNGNPFPKTGSIYNIQTCFGQAAVGIEDPPGTRLNVDVLGTGRILGAIYNPDATQVSSNDTNAITWYLKYKAQGQERNASLTDDQITYIEETLLPYMAQYPSIYGTLYKGDIIQGLYYLEFKDVSFLRDYGDEGYNQATRGLPKYYAQFDTDNFILSPVPDGAYEVQLSYLYRPESLTSTFIPTWLSTNAELTLLYGCLVEAYLYMKGEQDMMAYYDKRFNESLVGLKMLGEAKETTDQYRTGMVIRSKQ